jgi:hypothetical protein
VLKIFDRCENSTNYALAFALSFETSTDQIGCLLWEIWDQTSSIWSELGWDIDFRFFELLEKITLAAFDFDKIEPDSTLIFREMAVKN